MGGTEYLLAHQLVSCRRSDGNDGDNDDDDDVDDYDDGDDDDDDDLLEWHAPLWLCRLWKELSHKEKAGK